MFSMGKSVPLFSENAMSREELIAAELLRWKSSRTRRAMLEGERYYQGRQDIQRRKRTGIGADGTVEVLHNLANHQVVDNQFARMVDQKVNYLFGRPFLLECRDKRLQKRLDKVFAGFHHTLHALGLEALKCGIGWLLPYVDERGDFRFRRFPGHQVMPLWADAAHTRLDLAVRVYEQEVYNGRKLQMAERVEVYEPRGVRLYTLEKGRLIPCSHGLVPYVRYADADGGVSDYHWGTVPLIPFRYNAAEQPLLCKVKSLQDGINEMLSDFENHMQEDARNTILVLKNYDGTNLGEFRRNLAAYGIVKVKTVDGAEGGVESLRVEVGSEQYQVICQLLRRALCRNAMGIDARDERMSGSPNQMNIQSMYADIDLDANGMETEFQRSLGLLTAFAGRYLSACGVEGDLSTVRFMLNRDMLMNESEIMDMLYKGGLRLSNRSLVAQVPWVDDVDLELARLNSEQSTDNR